MDWLVVKAPAGADDITNSWIGQIPVGQVVAWIGFVGTLLFVLWRQGKRLRPLENFFRDWNGEDARPGVEERPGVMPRLARIEEHTKDAPTRSEFNKLAQQVTANTAVVELIKPHVTLMPPADGGQS